MKTTNQWFGALILIGALASNALANQIVNDITGTMVKSDSNCPGPVPLFDSDDCSYDATDPTGQGVAEWIGPLFNAGYYRPGDSPLPAGAGENDPMPGDGKTPPVISGTVTIDDQGTPTGADDTISATIIIGQTVRNFGAGARGTAEETWSSLTMQIPGLTVPTAANPVRQVIPPPTVSSATANSDGGFDYVIGSRGMPPRLVDAATGTDIWPSETGADADASVGIGHYWAAPSPIGIAPIEHNASIGTVASFTAADYSCVDKGDGYGGGASACDAKGRMGDGAYGPLNNGGQNFENILLALSTDAAGHITSAELIWVQQQDVVVPVGPDSWVAGLIEFSSDNVPREARDDTYSVDQNSANNVLNIGANDTKFGDPTTATINVAPDHGGVVTVQNSPGDLHAISIGYSPAPGFRGTEKFQYTMDDGVTTDSAVVTVNVGPIAKPDNANVTEGDTVEIDVTVGDIPGHGPLADHTVQITRPPNVGTAVVVAGNIVSYTAAPGSHDSAHGNDNFEYTLTATNGDVSPPATVQVGIGVDREPTPAGGVSSVDPWSLLLLAGALVRRRVTLRCT